MRGRRRVLAALGACLLMLSTLATGQPAAKTYRVGFLGARFRSTPAKPDVYYDAWLSGMRDLGYVEGKNLVIEWRFADNDFGRLPALAAELVALKPEVIVTHALPPTLALQRATSTIPIVFATMVDPVGNRVVPSLASPGGNVTGLSSISADLSGKRIEFLKKLVPSAMTVAVLVNPGTPAHPAMVKSLTDAGGTVGVRVLKVEARNEAEIPVALDAAVRQHADGLIVLDDAALSGLTSLIGRLALLHRLPSMMPTREFVEAGGLASYGMNMAYCYRRAAAHVDKILKGARPADLPIEQPTNIELVINRKTAAALGVRIPPELLVLADKVIE